MAKDAPKVIPGPDGKPERVNLAAVALRCGVNVRTVRDWVNEGRLPASKVGPKLWWVTVADLDAFLGGPQPTAGVLGLDDSTAAEPTVVPPVPEIPAAGSPGGSGASSGPVQAPGASLADLLGALGPDTPLDAINITGLPEAAPARKGPWVQPSTGKRGKKKR